IPGRYDLSFQPDMSTLAPLSILDLPLTADGQLDIPYPSEDTLLVVSGRVRNHRDVLTGVAGALVSGVDETTSPPLLSSQAVTDADGAFSLVFPPGASVFSITVRPGSSH